MNPRLRRRRPAPLGHALGRGQDAGRLRNQAARRQLSDHGRFGASLSEDENVGWLQRTAVIVPCRRNGGFRRGVVNASTCRTPALAAVVPGLSDSVQDGVMGLLVRKARPGPLAAAISKLLADEEARRRMSRRALAWSAYFDWDESAEAVLRAARRAVRLPAVPVQSAVRATALLAAAPGGAP